MRLKKKLESLGEEIKSLADPINEEDKAVIV